MNVDFNIDADHINVPIKKYSLIGYFLVVFAVLALGCCFIIKPSIFVSGYGYRYKSPWEIFDMGLLCVIICVPTAYLLLYRIIDPRPGLIVNLEGITDRSSLFAIGLINWADITQIGTEDDKYPVYVIVHVNNPSEYIQKQNIIVRYLASTNYKKYGSPVVIDAYQLKCDYAELCAFLEDTFKVYKKAAIGNSEN
jgi:hypothetical protein